ncbi:hypothetical protein [Nocardia sp. BMG51109]|uniref:Rv0361 family membrane protein n=1 Tax=Nocardia sp. BMG51109 TaxID=1056816 RepID=UPI0004639C51|nr:hypothetical protein [Nocardia sp. BMG51109]
MTDDAHDPIPIDQRDTTRSAVPFLAAAAVAVVVIGGGVALALARPTEKSVTPEDRIGVAVGNFATAQADTDAERRATAACQGFDPNRSPLGPDALGKKVEIARITDTAVDGDRAHATVTSRIDGRETTATWTLVHSGGSWLVCQ